MLLQSLLFPGINSGCDYVINLANVDHLLPEELPRAHAVLAPVRAEHLVHHLVRLHHPHRAHHLSTIASDLLKRLPKLEVDDTGGDQALSLHGELVFPLRFDRHQRLALVSKLPGDVSDPHGLHEGFKVLTLGQLELSAHLILYGLLNNLY